LGYSSLLGPIAGIMVVDYFIIKKQRLELAELYKSDGIYSGFNKAGLIAFGIPVALTLIAMTTDIFSWFYQFGWFTGSIMGGVVYFIVSKQQAVSNAGLQQAVSNDNELQGIRSNT
jgi:NCS1 family nucleobase:cation symporter-1